MDSGIFQLSLKVPIFAQRLHSWSAPPPWRYETGFTVDSGAGVSVAEPWWFLAIPEHPIQSPLI